MMQIRKMLITTVAALSMWCVPAVVFGQAYGKVEVETLNMRSGPSINTTNLGQLDQSDEVEIINKTNAHWLEIMMPSGQSAYVYAPYVSIQEAQGEINARGVRLRDYPNISESEVFDTLYTGDEVVIEYVVGDWCKVITKGKTGFVSKQFVRSPFLDELPQKTLEEVERIKEPQVQTQQTATATVQQQQASNQQQTQTKPQNSKPTPSVVTSNSGKADAIVKDAMQFLGGRYVFGGNSLTNGVDCSGFTQQIMKRHGISISRTSRSQFANDGYKVSRDQLQKGDLLFYGYNGSISHVALYIGNGQVIHANTSSTGIIISPAFSAGKPYIGAKRVL